MKALFVISTLRAGGAERVCALIASKFSEYHDVTLVKFDTDTPFYELNDRVNLINLANGVSERGTIGNLKKRLGKIFTLRNMIKKGEYDAVISFLDSTNLLVIASAFGLKTPVIISEHTSFDAPKKTIFKILKRVLYPYADALSVLTKSDARRYERFCKNVRVIHNPNFSRNDDKIELKKENLIIFAGRLNVLKNCEMFVRVAARLRRNGYEFAVAGEGDQKSELENLSKKLGANVRFYGNLADIGELYAKAKILLSCSKFEGLGNTLIEAVGFDCARIATKTSGAKELIKHEFDGFLCEIDDEKTMSETVLSLMQNEQKRIEICQNAKLRLNDFSLQNIYEQWLCLLKLGGVKTVE
ncbi:MAG: glycosyltransferase [Campylobacter sp.]|nr:glycosyltransferase [Campylobacter sp.]